MAEKHRSNSLWREVEPACVLRIILKNLWMVVLSAVAFALAVYIAATLLMKPSYTSSATFVISPKNTSSSSSTISASTADQFCSLLQGTMLRKQVSEEFGDAVNGVSVSAEAVKDTSVIRLSCTGPSPSAAYYMASGIVRHYGEWTPLIFNSVVLESVNAPNIPDDGAFRAQQRRLVMIAVPVGALVMVGILALFCILSQTVQTTVGARNQVDGKLLVTIRHEHKRRRLKSLFTKKKKKNALLISNPTTAFAYVETIRQLQTKVEHANKHHGCKTFVISSVTENEGKSTIAANLALSLAHRYQKVLLVDCDLRKASQSAIFGMGHGEGRNLNGLFQQELDPNALVRAMQYRKSDNLFCLLSANMRHNTASLLGSPRMRQILKILRGNFDYVIVDTPPMGYFTDATVLAEACDASILVVRQDKARDVAINDSIDSLRRCKARFLGFVFNDVRSLHFITRLFGGRGGYGYGYGYGYGKKGYSKKGYGYGYNSDKERIDAAPERKEET